MDLTDWVVIQQFAYPLVRTKPSHTHLWICFRKLTADSQPKLFSIQIAASNHYTVHARRRYALNVHCAYPSNIYTSFIWSVMWEYDSFVWPACDWRDWAGMCKFYILSSSLCEHRANDRPPHTIRRSSHSPSIINGTVRSGRWPAIAVHERQPNASKYQYIRRLDVYTLWNTSKVQCCNELQNAITSTKC